MKRVLKYLVLSLVFVAGNVYASPANDMFIDDNLYKCVVDAMMRSRYLFCYKKSL